MSTRRLIVTLTWPSVEWVVHVEWRRRKIWKICIWGNICFFCSTRSLIGETENRGVTRLYQLHFCVGWFIRSLLPVAVNGGCKVALLRGAMVFIVGIAQEPFDRVHALDLLSRGELQRRNFFYIGIFTILFSKFRPSRRRGRNWAALGRRWWWRDVGEGMSIKRVTRSNVAQMIMMMMRLHAGSGDMHFILLRSVSSSRNVSI